MIRISLLCVVCMLPSVSAIHGRDTNVCDANDVMKRAQQTSGPVPKKPQLPNQFKVRVECNIRDKNYTTDVHEWYDGKNNRGAIHQWLVGIEAHGIYSYNTNELIMVVIDPVGNDQCSVTDLSTDPNSFIFGVNNLGNGTDRIYSAAGALRFGGNIVELYTGKSDVRGIHSDGWYSCQYWDTMDATMNVTWYFSDRLNWDTAVGLPQIPLRCHVCGRRWVNDTYSYPFEHIYELVDFRDDISNDGVEFETPAGTICPGRKITKPHPTPGDFFSFKAEIYESLMGQIAYVTERYDRNMQLVSFETISTGGTFGNLNRLKTVDDFNSGVAYVMDVDKGNCTAVPIAMGGFDVEVGANNTVRMRSASEFFFSDNFKYTYEGIKSFRGISSDVWVGLRNDWPEGDSVNSTWEWYFATSDWLSDTDTVYSMGLPVGMVMKVPDMQYELTYNVYDYDEEEANIWKFDISNCFDVAHKQEFKLLLEGQYHDWIQSNLDVFKYAVILTISASTNISPLRVQGIKVDYNGRNVLLTFTVLDKAPIQGDVSNPATEKTLTDAVATLNTAITGGQLQIGPFNFDQSPAAVYFKVTMYSDALWGFVTPPASSDDEEIDEEDSDLKDDEDMSEYVIDEFGSRHLVFDVNEMIAVSCSSSTYGSGSMAGLAIGMLILGFLLVVIIGVLVYKVKTNAPFLPQRFEMGPQ